MRTMKDWNPYFELNFVDECKRMETTSSSRGAGTLESSPNIDWLRKVIITYLIVDL